MQRTLQTGVVLLLTLFVTNVSRSESIRFYIGTYTHGQSDGIYTAMFDTKTGAISPPVLAAKTVNPSFLAVSAKRKRVYAVNETTSFAGEKSGGVSAFAIEDDGTLRLLNQMATGGGAPCHLVLDHSAQHVLIANYMGGNASVFSLNADGALDQRTALVQHTGSSINSRRQEAPHAHSINLDAAGKFAFVADLGIDRILAYRFNSEQGTLAPAGGVNLPAGSGPRHFAFHPNGKYAYGLNELLGTISVFEYAAATGELTTLQLINTTGTGTAEILVHPGGKFVYASNRSGYNTIAGFAIQKQNGRLRNIGVWSTGGKEPRNFRMSPDGRFLLAENQNSGSIHVFSIDQQTGRLTPTKHTADVPTPVCIRFLKSEQ